MVMKCRTLIIKTNTTIGNNMTIKNDLYVYRVRHGSTRIRKYKLSKFLSNVNNTLFTKRFFINKKDAENYLKK